ncbi:MAG: hypothetical protein D9V47_12340 [Clostridia bacterium]|nr:MAG: hypothetical protein D9V47_12340 [Clostridia bacterium]
MSVDRLVEEIRRLSPKEQKELFKKLGLRAAPADKQRGGPSDPFSRLIGKVDGPGTGSRHYKEELYGGKAPL